MIPDFIVNNMLGVNGAGPVGSLRFKADNGLELMIAITSYR